MTPDVLDARKAIEALRSGVPSRTALKELGSTDTDLIDVFMSRLECVRNAKGTEPLGYQAPFGQGKTHLLIQLRTLAEEAGFATSVVVVSPETPLGNPVAVLAEISRNASVADKLGNALRELLPSARTNTDEWASLRIWATEAEIVQRFQALMFLYEEYSADTEFQARILEDIQGKPMTQAEINHALKEIDQRAAYNLRGTPPLRALAPERIRVLARWFRAYGRHGLVVFFDELERLGSFSQKQRMLAYEQIDWWTRITREDGSALLPVWFTTDDLAAITEKDERGVASELFGGLSDSESKTSIAERQAASPRWRGIQALSNLSLLEPPDVHALRALQTRLAELYGRAYSIERISDLEIQSQPSSIREEIRRWIAYWDMERLYPGYVPDIALHAVGEDSTGEWSGDEANEE